MSLQPLPGPRKLPRVGALAAGLALLAGCSAGPSARPAGDAPANPGIRWNSDQPPALAARTGALAFRFDADPPVPGLAAKSLPSNTNKVVLQLTSSALPAPMSIDILPSQFANGAVLFTVYSLPAAQYGVAAAVKDAANANLAAGSTTASVVAGATSPVTMLLTADPNLTTGGLQINIDTTSTTNAAAAMTLPSTGEVLQTVVLPSGSNPASLLVDSSGYLWVANNGTGKVTKVDLSTSPATLTDYTVGTGPMGVAKDGSGNIWITNNGSSTLHKISSAGTVSGPYNVCVGPAGIAIDGSGYAWVACNGTFTAGTGGSGSYVSSYMSSGGYAGSYYLGNQTGPWSIVIDSAGNKWVGTKSTATNGVSKISSGGTVTNYPLDVTVSKHLQSAISLSSDGSIWLANDGTSNATKLASDGTVTGHFSVGAAPWGIAVDGYKAVWVANSAGNTVTKLDSQGTVLGTYTLPAGTNPWGIALDARGNPWVAGHGNHTLVKLRR